MSRRDTGLNEYVDDIHAYYQAKLDEKDSELRKLRPERVGLIAELHSAQQEIRELKKEQMKHTYGTMEKESASYHALRRELLDEQTANARLRGEMATIRKTEGIARDDASRAISRAQALQVELDGAESKLKLMSDALLKREATLQGEIHGLRSSSAIHALSLPDTDAELRQALIEEKHRTAELTRMLAVVKVDEHAKSLESALARESELCARVQELESALDSEVQCRTRMERALEAAESKMKQLQEWAQML
ncbi:Chromosome partition protein Smc [Carpediemonas membranifera]|uniref:Chromosome partition protein Smc n=1 Tax=Carpediemonas membranifera TaxID=201153 RepID=A0A8J6AQ68_9EUKA|nr:Chromosome partition protein Smc [Carpediemonas membranifera]|eukprot:KAG9390643.1 Chromosome partition protein Smc [Carpediemonas membranifera]